MNTAKRRFVLLVLCLVGIAACKESKQGTFDWREITTAAGDSKMGFRSFEILLDRCPALSRFRKGAEKVMIWDVEAKEATPCVGHDRCDKRGWERVFVLDIYLRDSDMLSYVAGGGREPGIEAQGDKSSQACGLKPDENGRAVVNDPRLKLIE